MALARDLRAGATALWRHLRHSRGRPGRLLWILRRALTLAKSGRLRSVLERHAVVDDLYADYPRWLRRYEDFAGVRPADVAATLSARPAARITVLIPAYESDPRWLERAVHSVRRQQYPAAEILIVDDGSHAPETKQALRAFRSNGGVRVHERERNGGISACLNTGLDLVGTEFVAFLDHDDELHEAALLEMARAISTHPAAVLLYSDEDRIDEHGHRFAPHFKPDWNEEWIRTTNYVLHLCVARAATARAVGGFRSAHDGVQDWDFVLRMAERGQAGAVVHVPRVLYHWRAVQGSTAAGVYHKPQVELAQRRVIEEMLQRRDIAGSVERALYGWRIRYALPSPPPLVSIVILTRDHADLLRTCTHGILARTTYPRYELVIVDHASIDPDALTLLDALRSDPRVRILRYDGEFNYSAQCNAGVAASRGEVVVLLNNDVDVLDPDWLHELCSRALQPDVGIVGALLLYPNGTIQHAGVIVGLNGPADRPYVGYRRGYAGIAGRAQAAQDVSAVVTACAATRRKVFDQIGGFDERLAVSLNDVDLCLRAAAHGYRNVFTPHAEFVHAEGASRGVEVSPAELARAEREAALFAQRWTAWMEADPAYNINLTRSGQAFALGYPPRHAAAPANDASSARV